MMNNKRLYYRYLPYLFVIFQLGALAFIVFTGPLFSISISGLAVEFFGIALAAWAVVIMRSNANVTPVPKKSGVLVTWGPYKYIRHPMYIAQIIAVIPLVIDHPSPWRSGALLILIITLLFKLHYEEKRLVDHFGESYNNYQKQSKKLLPFIF